MVAAVRIIERRVLQFCHAAPDSRLNFSIAVHLEFECATRLLLRVYPVVFVPSTSLFLCKSVRRGLRQLPDSFNDPFSTISKLTSDIIAGPKKAVLLIFPRGPSLLGYSRSLSRGAISMHLRFCSRLHEEKNTRASVHNGGRTLHFLLITFILLTRYGTLAQVSASGISAPWLLSLASSGVPPKETPKPSATARYHSTQELLVKLNQLTAACPHAHPQWAMVFDSKALFFPKASKGSHGKLLVITLTYNAKERARDWKTHRVRDNRIRVVAVFGEHGRERITSELALSIVERYCSPNLKSMPHVLYGLEIVLIPVVNVAGRRAVENGKQCQRLNENGVDINRNYAVQWGQSDVGTLQAEEVAGDYPLSEWQTRAVDAVVRQTRPHGYLSFHSGERAILVPWDSGTNIGRGVKQIAKRVADLHCRECPVGTAFQLLGYRAYGTGVDHASAVYGVPFACTMEIFGKEDKYCEPMFNALDKQQFMSVMRNWSGVVETVGFELSRARPSAGASGRMRRWWWLGRARWHRYRVVFVTDSEESEEVAQHDAPVLFILFTVACFSLVVVITRKTFGRLRKHSALVVRRLQRRAQMAFT